MKRRELLVGLAAAAIAEGCTSQRPGSVQQSRAPESQARYTNQIALPEPSVAGTVPLEEAIELRLPHLVNQNRQIFDSGWQFAKKGLQRG